MLTGSPDDLIVIYKGRTTTVTVALGYDASGSTFTSQVRTEKNREADLVVTWEVSFLTDGTDGELVLTIDNTDADAITEVRGYMDLKKVSGGEPTNVWDEPLEVLIKDPVTA